MYSRGMLFELIVQNSKSKFMLNIVCMSRRTKFHFLNVHWHLAMSFDYVAVTITAFVMAFMDLISIRATCWHFRQANVRQFKDKCLLSLLKGRIAHFLHTLTGEFTYGVSCSWVSYNIGWFNMLIVDYYCFRLTDFCFSCWVEMSHL